MKDAPWQVGPGSPAWHVVHRVEAEDGTLLRVCFDRTLEPDPSERYGDTPRMRWRISLDLWNLLEERPRHATRARPLQRLRRGEAGEVRWPLRELLRLAGDRRDARRATVDAVASPLVSTTLPADSRTYDK